MLFNSYVFLCAFLPLTTVGFYVLASRRLEWAMAWLVLASLFFYGWWNPANLWLLLISLTVNYLIGRRFGILIKAGRTASKPLLTAGIVFNLAALGYFKYANFFLGNINGLVDTGFHLDTIVLPLAISFYTFQQIAYLVDAYRGEASEYSPMHYALFITFFPQLIAGPIVHHREIMPEFTERSGYRQRWDNIAVGLTIFTIGLFKKVILADTIATYATPVFASAEQGETLDFFAAWSGALAYTFQLYFDFSGYADMAIGSSRLFGIRLPLNFDSPYKSVNIIDFWRKWHMTLSRFLRDYLYIALGGNRKGRGRRHVNLMVTMLLGGLWHGAGWTFFAWGGLHGLYLVCNHGWRHFRATVLGHDLGRSTAAGRLAAGTLTFLAVVVGWVFFRAESFSGAYAMLQGMAGFNGASVPAVYDSFLNHAMGSDAAGMTNDLAAAYFNDALPVGALLLTVLAILAFLFPNTQEFMRDYEPALTGRIALSQPRWLPTWTPRPAFAAGAAFLMLIALTNMNEVSEFLYFQF